MGQYIPPPRHVIPVSRYGTDPDPDGYGSRSGSRSIPGSVMRIAAKI